MNVIAIDIGNTNINIALFLDNEEKSIESIAGGSQNELESCLKKAWEQIPVSKSSKENKREGVIVISSVKPEWTKTIEKIVKNNFNEKIFVIGKEIPLPISLWVDEPDKVG